MSWSTPLTALPHLSDEAVAAFADGVLSETARQRAQSHMAGCGECSDAVRGQRAASALLRSAPSPSLPADLLARLRELPITTELPASHFAAALTLDGQPVFASFGAEAIVDHRAPIAPPALPTTRPANGVPVSGSPAPRFPAPGLPTNGLPTPVLPTPVLPTNGLPGPAPLSSPPAVSAHHQVAPAHRHTSTRAGFGAAAAAALAVGVLASTAATAGGVTPTRSISPISRVAPTGAAGRYGPTPTDAPVELSVLTFTTSSGK